MKPARHSKSQRHRQLELDLRMKTPSAPSQPKPRKTLTVAERFNEEMAWLKSVCFY